MAAAGGAAAPPAAAADVAAAAPAAAPRHAELLSSRVCIKNVPRHCNEARLREHFAARGEVTDAKVLRTRRVRAASACLLCANAHA
jgi:RNA recognition motif-containing protein